MTAPEPPPDEELAPRWHTALLVVGMLALAAASAFASKSAPGAAPEAPTMSSAFRIFGVYLPMVIVQALLVVYVARFGRGRWALGALLGRGLRPLRSAAIDVGAALGAVVVLIGAERLWATYASILTKQVELSPAVAAALPHTPVERVAWIAVAFAVGFSEELVYRGYLQRQCAALAPGGSWRVGLVCAAALFGLVHAEQGPAVVLRFTVYGIGFGLLARARGSLWPGILCHALNDLLGGMARGAGGGG